jgi:hypothetical protein
MQEKEFNEKVRQYNENMAWQKQQYQDQLSRQSLGRSYSSGGRSSRGSSGGSSRSSGGSSGTLSNAGKTLLNSLSKNKAKGALGGGVAAALSQNINSLNSAYKSGKITASDVKLISKKLGL